MSKLAVGFTAAVALAGAGLAVRQEQANALLRAEIAALHGEVEAAHAAARAARPAMVHVAPATAEPARDDERAELARLREEIGALKKRTQEIAQQAQAAQQAARGESTVPLKLIPVAEWKNGGRATVPAAVETLLWAAQGGDVEVLTGALQLDAAARAKAEALIAGLPEASRAQFGTPEKLVALFLAKDAAGVTGMQILGQRDISAEVVGVRVRFANEEGKTKEEGLGFARTTDGLKMIVPEKIVDKYAQQLKGPRAPGK